MKKLIASTLSLLTSAIFAAGSGTAAAAAEVTDALTTVSGTFTPSVITEDGLSGMTFTLGDSSQYLSNFSEDSYSHKVTLDKNNAAVYEAISKLTEPSFDTLTIKLPEKVSFTTSSLDNSSDFTQPLFENCKPGMDLCLFDMPEIFWLDESKIEAGLGDVSYTYSRTKKLYTVTFDELMIVPAAFSSFSSVSDIEEYKEKLEDAVDDYADVSGTRYEMIKSIHDRICNFTYYDEEAAFANSAVGAIVEPGVVCEGYSKAMKLVCDKLDIPCIVAVGNFEEDGLTAHMWNYVKMDDGKWYALDVTWDDYDGKYGVDIQYTYFLKGADSFSNDHTPATYFNLTTVGYPEISASDYDVNWQASAPATTTARATTTTTKASTTTTAKVTTTTTARPTTTTTKATTVTTTKASTTTSTAAPTSTTTKKKPSSTTTTVTTTAPVTTTTAPLTEPLYGDLNQDGEVNVADLVCCGRAVLGKETYEFSCDVNGDGRLTVFDVLIMRELILQQG